MAATAEAEASATEASSSAARAAPAVGEASPLRLQDFFLLLIKRPLRSLRLRLWASLSLTLMVALESGELGGKLSLPPISASVMLAAQSGSSGCRGSVEGGVGVGDVGGAVGTIAHDEAVSISCERSPSVPAAVSQELESKAGGSCLRSSSNARASPLEGTAAAAAGGAAAAERAAALVGTPAATAEAKGGPKLQAALATLSEEALMGSGAGSSIGTPRHCCSWWDPVATPASAS
mmetsp:Transcript_43482/g.137496  ORF Transcript_43482/g.137496 Transcript_43482/m.137496 type:complete len:235 (+) Transcript_43482:292-996(+)